MSTAPTINRCRAKFIFCLIAMFTVGWLGVAKGEAPAELDGNRTIGTGDQNPIVLKNPAQTVAYNTGWYNFAEGNLGPITNGLNMAGFYLRNTRDYSTIRINLNGGPLVATSGYIRTGVPTYQTGSIAIYNVGDIAMGNGYISTRNESITGHYRNIGSIAIGQSGLPAGDIQVAYIEARREGASQNNDPQGRIEIYGAGDVLIQNSARNRGALQRSAVITESLLVYHNGSFRAGTVGTTWYNTSGSQGRSLILFDGWYSGTGDPEGAFDVTKILSRANVVGNNWRNVYSAHVTVRNYDSVAVAENIETYHEGLNSQKPGDITVNNIVGDISIGGTVNAKAASGTAHGDVRLQAGGIIALGSLDLSKVGFALLNPGAKAEITGEIRGTNGLALAGDGAGTLSNAGTALRVPAGKTLQYHSDQNPALQDGTYILANANGVAGEGGTLAPAQPSGTVIRFR